MTSLATALDEYLGVRQGLGKRDASGRGRTHVRRDGAGLARRRPRASRILRYGPAQKSECSRGELRIPRRCTSVSTTP
jgi:hypothetical protein